MNFNSCAVYRLNIPHLITDKSSNITRGYKIHGNKAYYNHITKEFRYEDDDSLADPNKDKRACPHCKKDPVFIDSPTGKYADGCFKEGIECIWACCCGHGTDEGYVSILAGWRI